MSLLLLASRKQRYLEIYTNSGPATGTFDPSITTAYITKITCDYGDGSSETLSGTSHAFSHTYAALGTYKVRFRGAPLSAITVIDCNTDLITKFRNLSKLTKCTSLTAYTNAGLVLDFSQLPAGLTDASFNSCSLLTGAISQLPTGLTYASFNSCSLLTGALSDLPTGLTVASFYDCPLLTGSLSDLPAGLTVARFFDCPLLTGSLSDLPAGLTTARFYGCPLLTGDSIAQLTAISDIRIYNNGWNQATVDAVIDSIYQAVVADANHFTAAAPALQIQANNAAPSGVYQEATPPTTGLEKVYYLCHLPAHAWSITWNGGSGP